MKAVLLAAGYGRRLKALTKDVPKPMLEVGGRPVIEYAIRLLSKFGIKDIIINLHYKPGVITNYLGDGKKMGVRITYSYEPVLLGTAGAVKNVAHLLRKTFIVAYGDTLRKIDLSGMLRAHKKNKADLTIALYKANNCQGCGIANIRNDNSVREFIEKPKGAQGMRRKPYANCGIYIIEPRILDCIPSGERYDFSRQLFPFLIKKGYRIYGHPAGSRLIDIGTPGSYAQAKKSFKFFRDL